MKRSPSPTPHGTDNRSSHHSGQSTSPSPKKARSSPENAKTTAKTTPKKTKATSSGFGGSGGSSTGGGNGTWTPAIKSAFVEDIIAAGYKAADIDALAIKYGMTRAQLLNQLTPGRSNLRSRLVKAAGEM